MTFFVQHRAPLALLALGLFSGAIVACEGAIGADFDRAPRSSTLPNEPGFEAPDPQTPVTPEAGTQVLPPVEDSGSVRAACGDMNGLDPRAPWPMAGYCPTRANVSPTRSLKTPRIAWRYKYEARGAALRTQPVIGGDGTIYVIASSIPTTAIVCQLIGVKDNVETMRIDLPQASFANTPSTPVLARDGSIYVAGGGWLSRLTLGGTEMWKVSLGAAEGGSPLILGDGTLVVSAAEGVRGIRPADGSTAWTYRGAGFTGSVAMTTTGLLVIAQSPAPNDYHGHVHMFDERGNTRWVTELGLGASQSPSTDAMNRTFVGAGSQFVRIEANGAVSSIANVTGNSLSENLSFSAMMFPKVHWIAGNFDPISFDPETGTPTSHNEIEGVTSGFVGTGDGTMVVAIRNTRNDRVEGMNQDGTTRWSVPIEPAADTPNTPALGLNGSAYVTVDNMLYAITDP